LKEISSSQWGFDFLPYRPPSEANSALLRVTRGCPWNRCVFCGMYRNVKFEVRPFEEIAEDIDRLDHFFPGSETLFIGDSNSLLHKELIEIVKRVKQTFPNIKRITSYARAHTLQLKSEEYLKELRDAGLTRLHVGLESGDETILKRICKGASPEIMIEGGRKSRQAGFELCFYVLCGVGGEAFWREHADGTARVINAVNPDFARLRTVSILPDTPLYETWKAGKFDPITPLSRLKETRRLIERLNVSNCEVVSDHVTNYLWAGGRIIYRGVEGELPQRKESMLNELDAVIEEVSKRDDILDAKMEDLSL
jgi:biotin synthase-like enzyme